MGTWLVQIGLTAKTFLSLTNNRKSTFLKAKLLGKHFLGADLDYELRVQNFCTNFITTEEICQSVFRKSNMVSPVYVCTLELKSHVYY